MTFLAIGIAASGIGFVGLGLGYLFGKYVEGVARNPGAVKEMNRMIFIWFGLIEATAIYILVLAFLLYGKAA
ncbi:MAG: ATP synthase F0 subunit C [Nitrospirota bacterium]